MLRVRQEFERPLVRNLVATVHDQLSALDLSASLKPGETVAIPVGSRGISNIAEITKGVVDFLKTLGAVPIIVPAMGSHGGATATGQRQLIESYGVTEEYLGAEIRSSMETVVVDTTPQGIPVHFDRNAYEADHVLIMGRVKPHTGFVGEIESGLHKMMLIGLGKHAGALIYHRAIKDYSFETIIRSVADVVLKTCGVLAGLAIVENAYDETALIEAVPPQRFYERERKLLEQAIEWMPQLPFPDVDLLIVDRIGKDISGTGIDTNIVGRKYNDHAATEKDNARCKRIHIRGLTPGTKGNALGIGLAEFTTQAVIDVIDQEQTRINSITSCHPTGGMLPFAYPNDRLAIKDALGTIGLTEPEDARVMQISDTLHLSELLISERYLSEEMPAHVQVIEGPFEFPFDETDAVPPVFEGRAEAVG